MYFRAQYFQIALAGLAQRKSDVLLDRHRIEQSAALKKNSDFLTNGRELPFGHANDVLAFNPNFSRIRLHQTDKMFEQHTLAAPAAADNREGLTARDFKIDPAQDFLLADSLH